MTCPGCGAPIAAGELACAGCTVPDETPTNIPVAAVFGPPAWLQLPLTDLATAVDDTRKWLEEQETRLQPARDRVAKMREVLLARMEADGATELAHPYLIVKREKVESRPNALIDVLRRGFDELVKDGVLKADDVAPGLYLERKEPEWRVNLTKLKTLARFGERVKALLSAGVQRLPPSFRLVVQPNPKVIASDSRSPKTPTTQAPPSSK